MSGHDNEDLIDYEDDGPITSSINGAPTVDGDKEKKNFSGIHSTGFRYFLHLHIMLTSLKRNLQRFSSQARVVACYQRLGV